MRLFKYLGKHKGAIALVFVLLMCQAFCDLMLPNYTSQIVDVGIQQSGIEHVAADELSPSSHDAVAASLTGADEQLFAESYEYDFESGVYVLTSSGQQNRATLDEIMALPLAHARGFAVDESSSELIAQSGLAAAQAEYRSLGYDLASMQISYLLVTALKMLGFVFLSTIIAVSVGFVASRTGAKVGRGLRSALFSKVMSFSDAEIQRFSAASLITRATNDVQQIQMMCIMFLRMVLYAPILGIGGVIMVARTNLSLSWIIGLAVLVIIVWVVALMLIAMPKFKMMQKLIDRVNLVSREMLTGVSVVRAFGQQAHEQARFDVASTDLMRTQLFTSRVMAFMMPVMFLVMNLVSIGIVWVGSGQVDAGIIQTGDLIAFITYSMIIIMSFLMLGFLAIIAPRADVAAQRIDEVLGADVSIADPDKAPVVDSEWPFEGLRSGAAIEFDHVTFAYDDDSEPVLYDVTFKVAPGETCAIIGSTGSGKSTVLKLIERFYDASEGAVRIDGTDVREMPLRVLREQLGYVPQRSFLFSGTIESNVGFGEGALDEAAVREAIDIAQATELVDAQKEGLQAEITQGGTNVSGGQRQRLAIARALATNARALLFDDSFSALDYKTDAALRRALEERLPGKTQIIVAQRIATVMNADNILVLDEGRIVGEGAHQQLLATCPQYREIAYSQLSPEELEGGERL